MERNPPQSHDSGERLKEFSDEEGKNSEASTKAYTDIEEWRSTISDNVYDASALFNVDSDEEDSQPAAGSNITGYDTSFFENDEIGDDERDRYYNSLNAKMDWIKQQLQHRLKSEKRKKLRITMVTEKPSIARELAVH